MDKKLAYKKRDIINVRKNLIVVKYSKKKPNIIIEIKPHFQFLTSKNL